MLTPCIARRCTASHQGSAQQPSSSALSMCANTFIPTTAFITVLMMTVLQARRAMETERRSIRREGSRARRSGGGGNRKYEELRVKGSQVSVEVQEKWKKRTSINAPLTDSLTRSLSPSHLPQPSIFLRLWPSSLLGAPLGHHTASPPPNIFYRVIQDRESPGAGKIEPLGFISTPS